MTAEHATGERDAQPYCTGGAAGEAGDSAPSGTPAGEKRNAVADMRRVPGIWLPAGDVVRGERQQRATT